MNSSTTLSDCNFIRTGAGIESSTDNAKTRKGFDCDANTFSKSISATDPDSWCAIMDTAAGQPWAEFRADAMLGLDKSKEYWTASAWISLSENANSFFPTIASGPREENVAYTVSIESRRIVMNCKFGGNCSINFTARSTSLAVCWRKLSMTNMKSLPVAINSLPQRRTFSTGRIPGSSSNHGAKPGITFRVAWIKIFDISCKESLSVKVTQITRSWCVLAHWATSEVFPYPAGASTTVVCGTGCCNKWNRCLRER